MNGISLPAFDLGFVDDGVDTWRSLGFDLRDLHGHFAAATVLVDTHCDEAGALCVGDGFERVTHSRAMSEPGPTCCRLPLNDQLLARLNAAAGGFFQVDGWTDRNGARAALGRPRVRIELTALPNHIRQRAA